LKPRGELLSSEATRGKIEHQAFLFVESAQKFQPIEQQKYFHRGMGDTLVAIDEGVIQRQGKAEGGRLVDAVGCRSVPPNVARGCARADSSR
jgi:hypothetical protein